MFEEVSRISSTGLCIYQAYTLRNLFSSIKSVGSGLITLRRFILIIKLQIIFVYTTVHQQLVFLSSYRHGPWPVFQRLDKAIQWIN